MKELDDLKLKLNQLNCDLDLGDGYRLLITPNKDNSKIYHWHPAIILSIRKESSTIFQLHTVNLSSGCGSLLFYGYNVFYGGEANNKVINVVLKRLLELYKESGVGSIITTVGQSHYDDRAIDKFYELGFKEISEYNNHRHGSNYKQKLLQLIIK